MTLTAFFFPHRTKDAPTYSYMKLCSFKKKRGGGFTSRGGGGKIIGEARANVINKTACSSGLAGI